MFKEPCRDKTHALVMEKEVFKIDKTIERLTYLVLPFRIYLNPTIGITTEQYYYSPDQLRNQEIKSRKNIGGIDKTLIFSR